MCRTNISSWHLALAGILTVGSLSTPAQSPANLPLPQPSVPAPVFQPTPEQLADSLMARQRYQAAIEAYKNVPLKSAETWNKLGVAYQLMYNTQDAARCYAAALKLDPKSAIVMNNLGSIYMEQKQYSKAERNYRHAAKLDPHSALFRKNLGTALLAQRKYKKGWEAYQHALTIDPNIFTRSNGIRVQNPASVQDRGAMNYYMAKGCVRAGMNDQAIQYLRKALNEGFVSPKKIIEDNEFAAIRDLPAFQQMISAQTGQSPSAPTRDSEPEAGR